MAILDNLANSLKSTVTSSSGNVSSALDKIVEGVSKVPNPDPGIIKPIPTTPIDPGFKPIPTDPGIIKPIPTTPIDPGFKPLPTDPGIIKPIPTTPIDPGFKPIPTDPGIIKPIPTTPIDPGFKPLPTDPGIIKPIPTTPIDPGFKPLPTDPGIIKPIPTTPIDPGFKPLPYETKPLNPTEPVEFKKNTGFLENALDKAQAEQIKESASGYLNDKNGFTNDELQNKLMENENFIKLNDAEVKEKMKELYFKEGLNEEQVKNKLKETENLSSSELKEKFKEQYNNALVNGLINKTPSSFIASGASGLVSGGDRMSITVSEIPNIVSKLRSCESRVREIWSDLLNTYINQIENSWAGADAQAYIEKVRGYNTKIENSAQALSLLADTYEKVMATSQDTQQKVMNAVNNY